jgi:hypothetical protein
MTNVTGDRARPGRNLRRPARRPPGHPGERRYTEATVSYTEGRPAVYVASCNGKAVATYPVTQTLSLGV